MSAELPRTFKIATIWLLAGVLVFVAIQWWQREQAQMRFHAAGDVIEIRLGFDGHYHWPGSINGHRVDFLVDTGATGTAISATLARELGLESRGAVQSSTAGGVVSGQMVRADVALQGGVRAERLRIVALPGLDDRPLLGMDVLGRLHWQQRDGVLRIDLRAAGTAESAVAGHSNLSVNNLTHSNLP
ncbi:MAG: retroviral-like aspartic protease family protein [Pseudomonadota bacterium]|nr:retroviral-like aspartic protease family protein [Pseudomonadota bacterium]